MRTLDERMAEISRRSEVIFIEHRQRRKHILMACIPLVLSVTMFSVFILPAMMTAGSINQNAAPENADGHHINGTRNDELSLSAGTVEVSGTGVSHYYTSVEDVQEIMGLINSIVSNPEPDNDVIRDFVTNESYADRDEAYEENGHSIIVTRSDGMSTEYLLLGTMLIDQNTNDAFPMDEKTYFELKDALGIPSN